MSGWRKFEAEIWEGGRSAPSRDGSFLMSVQTDAVHCFSWRRDDAFLCVRVENLRGARAARWAAEKICSKKAGEEGGTCGCDVASSS